MLRDFFWTIETVLVFHVRRFWPNWLMLLGAALLLGGLVWLTIAPPADFPKESIVVVARGATASEIATEFGSSHLVRHPAVLRFLLRTGAAKAGGYRFTTPENTVTIGLRLLAGDFGIAPTKITFPEGLTVREMADRISEKIPTISSSDFIAAAGPYEGYLFPDTYHIAPDATAEDVVRLMRENFAAKTAGLKSAIEVSGNSFSDIVIMASILEREARSLAEKKMVAGILWNRIARGMPLQVDAVFGYIYGRDTFSPSLEDLAIDSPYNTYKNKGLPPGPISNPGLASLEAAAAPTKSNYLYYLTGSDGKMYYATTFTGHKANRTAYLK